MTASAHSATSPHEGQQRSTAANNMEKAMTKPTELNKDLETLNQLTTRVRDLEFLFRYSEHDVAALIDYLVTDYGFARNELNARPTIEIWGEIEILQSQYGLSFEYVAAGTFEDQAIGYFRYQLSYGGPSEEFRFFVDPEHNLITADFWLLDWFTGASIDCTDQPTVQAIWDHFQGTMSSFHAFRKAMNE